MPRVTRTPEKTPSWKTRFWISSSCRSSYQSPGVTWRAQKSLFGANMRYMGLALKPALWMVVPVGLLLIHLESFYGRAPLPVAHEALITMGMAQSWNPQSAAPNLAVPAEVEPKHLKIAQQRWRLRNP